MEDNAVTMSDRSNFSTDSKYKAAREKFDKQHPKLQVSKEKCVASLNLERQTTHYFGTKQTGGKKSISGLKTPRK